MNDIRLSELAQLVGGQLVGGTEQCDTDVAISGAETLRDADSSQITFAVEQSYAAQVNECAAAAVVVDSDFGPTAIPAIVVENVLEAFAAIVSHFRAPRTLAWQGISREAHCDATCKLAPGVQIYPGAFVDEDVEIGLGSVVHAGATVLAGTRIGAGVTIFPNAVIYENCVIGDRCLIHANAVIGAFGFGYDSSSGKHILSHQIGNVVIEDDVEIGAGTTIDRGTFGSTKIGEGTKIDNQVMIGHNCRIGKHNLLCSQVGIAGSCTTGDYVVMAGQVGIGDHLDIEDRAVLGAKAGVMTRIPAGEQWVGIPATPMREQLTKQAALAKLPQMRKQMRQMQQEVDQLKVILEDDSDSSAEDRQDAA